MDPLRFRCPRCHRLYSSALADIGSEKPEFQCLTCEVTFGFDVPPKAGVEEIPTYELPLEAPTKTLESLPVSPISGNSSGLICPSCSFDNLKGAMDCARCGVVFSKLGRNKSGAAKDLESAWQTVVENYSVPAIHEQFIQECFSKRQLPFASQRYREILDANPLDDIALRMRDKIIALTTVTFVPPRRDQADTPKMGFVYVILCLAAVLILTGLFSNELRSLVFVGGGLALVGFGFRKYSRL